MATVSLGAGLRLDGADDVAEFVKKLEADPEIKSVDLSGNTLGIAACERIAQSLEGLHSLESVDFSDCFTGRLKEEIPPALEYLCNAVMDKKNLTKLNVSNNAFGRPGTRVVGKLISSNPSIRVLHISNCGLTGDGGKIISESIRQCSESFPDSPGLEAVVAGRNRLETPGALALAEAFASLSNLKEVRIYQNGIRPRGIRAVAKALLGSASTLEHVDFQDNFVKKAGAQAVAEMMEGLPNLKKLNLGDCMLGNMGGAIIAKALNEHCPSLQVIDLSYGPFNTDVALQVVDAALKKTDLTNLELNGNCVTEEGLEELNKRLESESKEGILGEMDENDDEGEGDDESDGAADSDDEEAGSEADD